MKTKPEDVSSTILPSSPQEGLHLLSSEKEYRGECRSESSSSEQKRGSQAGQTQVRDPGCTPRPLPQSCMTSSHTRDAEGKGLKPGATAHSLLCRTVRLAGVLQIQHSPAETGFRHQEMYGDKTPHKEKVPHQSWNAELCIYQSGKWGLRRIQSLNAQSQVLPDGCHGLFLSSWILLDKERGPENVVTSFLL